MVSQLTSDLARIAVYLGSVVDIIGRSHAGGVIGKVEQPQLMLPQSTVAVYDHLKYHAITCVYYLFHILLTQSCMNVLYALLYSLVLVPLSFPAVPLTLPQRY